jgi:serine O-acetyltransferase
MSAERLGSLRLKLTRVWLISPERLWLLSIALQRRGHWILAFSIKQLNTILYHNSLSPGASVSPDILLGHYSHGIVVNSNVEIGRRVKIWHNVTLTAGRQSRKRGHGDAPGPEARIIIEDGVKIGTNAVVIAPRGGSLRIGRGARIGAGATVTEDVPSGATVVSQPVRVLLRDADGARDADAQATAAEIGFPEHSADPPRGDPPGRDGA